MTPGLPAETIYEYFPVKDYLSEGEMQKLFEYRDTLNVDMTYEEAVERYGEVFAKMEDPSYKRHSMNLMLDNSFELIGIEIEEKIIQLSDGALSEPEEARIVWEWKKENEEGNPESTHSYTGEMIFPYRSLGESARRRWEKDEWLQGYQEKINNLGQFAKEKGTNSQGQICQIVLFGKTEEDQYDDSRQYLLVLRETSHPWLAATQDMKYIYLAGAVLTLACMINVIYSTHKTYQEREKLESMRHDFTNAAAHELKTPLSVIRGFAENLKEDTIKEKREYYLDQIIDQTEQIDNLVKEMIHISKMDSDVILQNRQQCSLVELVKEQMNKLHLQIEEKNLRILYEVEQEFLVEADLDKMGRAIWNLLSNATEYNRLDGSIWIFSEKDKLTIENTGEAIPDDALPHVFEMFYTGDESRHERSRHMGLGLYLAKRICEMHALKIEICNTDEGVKITILR